MRVKERNEEQDLGGGAWDRVQNLLAGKGQNGRDSVQMGEARRWGKVTGPAQAQASESARYNFH